MSRDWWIDEGDFAGAEHLDAAYVAGYEAKAQFDPTDDIVALEALGMGPGSTVVDLGAGTGVFAFAAAATGADVFAVDVSPAMTPGHAAPVATSPYARPTTGPQPVVPSSAHPTSSSSSCVTPPRRSRVARPLRRPS